MPYSIFPAFWFLNLFKVGYENTFLQRFNGSHHNAISYIENTIVFVQTYFCHYKSLGSELELERLGKIKHFDTEMISSNYASSNNELASSNKVLLLTKQEITNEDLMVYMTGSPKGLNFGSSGCIGCVCNLKIGKDQIEADDTSIDIWGKHIAVVGPGEKHHTCKTHNAYVSKKSK